MADEPKVLFEVDASKILAKLHLAGVQSIELDAGEFFVNSGVKNDDPTAKPDNPGKVEFDLTNAQGEYEVGYVGSIKYERSFDVQKKLDELAKEFSKAAGKEILAKTKDADDKHKKDLIDQLEKDAGIKVKSIEDIEAAQEEAKKQNESNMEDYNDQRDAIKKKAAIAIKQYLTVFAGVDKTKGVSEDSLVMINISDKAKDSKDPALVKNFEIRPLSDKEKELMLKKFQADPKNCEERVCFKVGYTIEIEK